MNNKHNRWLAPCTSNKSEARILKFGELRQASVIVVRPRQSAIGIGAQGLESEDGYIGC